MTLEEMAKVDSEYFNRTVDRVLAENNALLNRLQDADFGYKKPTAWQAFKYSVLSRIKAAVRWCTRWAWDGYCD